MPGVDGHRPWMRAVDFHSGSIRPHDRRTVRRLSDMAWAYRDRDAVRRALDGGDPVMYEIYEALVPEQEGHLLTCTTVLHPGRIGDEYFMTKGHYHALRETGEVYLTLRGEGLLLMETEQGETAAVKMGVREVAYVPPGWAHRTVNTGDEPLVFLAVYPAHAGHDYAAIERAGGFRKRVVHRDGKAVVVDR